VRASAPAKLGDSMLLCSAESERHSAEAAELAHDEMPDASQAQLEQIIPLVLEVDACEPAPT
jgi:hypothetical protein